MPLKLIPILIKRFVHIQFQFEAVHCWPECGIVEVDYLKYPHRHVFYVKMTWEVTHNDRDIEFIDMKNKVTEFVGEKFHHKNLGRKSCEEIAELLMGTFSACEVSVYEDNENGVTLKWQE